MDAQEFRKDFLEDVKASATISGEGSCASFVVAFAKYLENAEYLCNFMPSYFEGFGRRNRRLRVDGYAFDELDKTMTLIIADYAGYNDNRTLGVTFARQLQERLANFVVDSLTTPLHQEIEMSRGVADLVDILKNTEIRKFLLLIFTTSGLSSRITALEGVDVNGINSDCQIWDIERLFRVCASSLGRDIIEVDFAEYGGIPCMEASNTAEFKSFLCVMPAVALANIYDKYGSSLLEGNVRSFLTTKVAVNKKIRNTILDNPERFFAYNNGISATAMSINLQGNNIVSAMDFQIINGGQTTASLSTARFKDKADLSKIYVQMKLTIIEKTRNNEATGLVQDISRSSNSQSKVSDADFFSAHPFHVRMENCSKRLYAKATGGSQFDTIWFYERTRGQFLQEQLRMTVAQKKKFLLLHPKNQVITKPDLAKVRNTWAGLPHLVSRGAQTNFSEFAEKISDEWIENNARFDDRYFQETVALCLIHRFMEGMIPKQGWFQSSYRANIVTYTIALLRVLIQNQFGKELDLMGIWAKQVIPSIVEETLKELSELVYFKLTDVNRDVVNVTQWCKREKCWNEVEKIPFVLSGKIVIFLN